MSRHLTQCGGVFYYRRATQPPAPISGARF